MHLSVEIINDYGMQMITYRFLFINNNTVSDGKSSEATTPMIFLNEAGKSTPFIKTPFSIPHYNNLLYFGFYLISFVSD